MLENGPQLGSKGAKRGREEEASGALSRQTPWTGRAGMESEVAQLPGRYQRLRRARRSRLVNREDSFADSRPISWADNPRESGRGRNLYSQGKETS